MNNTCTKGFTQYDPSWVILHIYVYSRSPLWHTEPMAMDCLCAGYYHPQYKLNVWTGVINPFTNHQEWDSNPQSPEDYQTGDVGPTT